MAGGGRTRRHLRLIRVRNYSIQMIVTCRTYLASVGIEGGLLDRRHLSGGGRHHITRIRSRQVCINLMSTNESKERIKISHISLFLNTI